MAFAFSSFQRHRRGIAGILLVLLLQSLAWGVGAASSADVLDSAGANAAVHEQGCTDEAIVPAGQEPDSHCNEACHFWSQMQIVFAGDVAPAVQATAVMRASNPTYAFINRSTPPFRPPRLFLPV